MRTPKYEGSQNAHGSSNIAASLSDLKTDFIDPSLRHIGAQEKRYAEKRHPSAQRDTSLNPLSELRPAPGAMRVGFSEFLD
jgi:hypothetical protein